MLFIYCDTVLRGESGLLLPKFSYLNASLKERFIMCMSEPTLIYFIRLSLQRWVQTAAPLIFTHFFTAPSLKSPLIAEPAIMSFRGRGGGGFRGGDRGRGGGRGGFRGGRGGGRGGYDQGPPERVVPLGTFSHACQEDLVVKSSIQDVPYFNAPIYLENITQVCDV